MGRVCCKAARVRELVALDLDGGAAFVGALIAVFDDGDVALPVGRSLSGQARRRLFEAARPHAVVVLAADGVGVTRRRLDDDAPPTGSGDALLVASSGSTGTPKLILHTHAGLRAHADAVHTRLEVDTASDRWLACLPLDHLGGLGVIVRSLATATPLDVWPGPDVAGLATAPADLGTTLVSLVPTVLDRFDATGYRRVVLGGSADPVLRPPNVTRTYGMTETGGGVVYDGRPLDDIEVDVGADGVIALRGPTTARGRRSADGSVAPVTDDGGWLRTGDLGSIGTDGRLRVHGRVDDLIISGGENVWPGPVAQLLAAHPGVAEVHVEGHPDPVWGQRVVAFVVPVDALAPPTLTELRAAVTASASPASAPRELILVDHLDRSSLGKVRRQRPSDAQ